MPVLSTGFCKHQGGSLYRIIFGVITKLFEEPFIVLYFL
jgi:hypothetical protein